LSSGLRQAKLRVEPSTTIDFTKRSGLALVSCNNLRDPCQHGLASRHPAHAGRPSQLSRPANARGDAIVGLSYSYRGDYFTSKENEAASLVDSYAIVNARLGWRSQDERWEVFAFARNLLDERYLVDRFEETLLFPQLIATYGQPRTYGLQVSAQF